MKKIILFFIAFAMTTTQTNFATQSPAPTGWSNKTKGWLWIGGGVLGAAGLGGLGYYFLTLSEQAEADAQKENTDVKAKEKLLQRQKNLFAAATVCFTLAGVVGIGGTAYGIKTIYSPDVSPHSVNIEKVTTSYENLVKATDALCELYKEQLPKQHHQKIDQLKEHWQTMLNNNVPNILQQELSKLVKDFEDELQNPAKLNAEHLEQYVEETRNLSVLTQRAQQIGFMEAIQEQLVIKSFIDQNPNTRSVALAQRLMLLSPTRRELLIAQVEHQLAQQRQ